LFLGLQNNIYKLFSLLNYASIDVAVAAATQLYVVTHIFNAPQSQRLAYPLFAVVLVFYWLDHIIDYYRKKWQSPRHIFVYKNRLYLLIAAIFLMVKALIIAYPIILNSMLPEFLLMVTLLAIYTTLHFIKKTKHVTKELMVSVCYSYAICFPIISHNNIIYMVSVGVTLFLLVMQNMLMVNIHEAQIDYKNSSSNIILVFSKSTIKSIMHALFFAQLIITVLAGFYFNLSELNNYFLCLLVAAGLQQLLVYNNKYYRILGEWAFALPGLLLI
jgi:hypothetical protein